MALQKLTSWAERVFTPDKVVQRQFALFQALLREDRVCLKLITKLEEIAQRPLPCDWARIALLVGTLSAAMERLTRCLEEMKPGAYGELVVSQARIAGRLAEHFSPPEIAADPPYALPLEEAREHPTLLGGKAAALARIRRESGIPVQPALVITINAFQAFIAENNLQEEIARRLRSLNLRQPRRLEKVSRLLREMIMAGRVPAAVEESVRAAIAQVAGDDPAVTWAVRSSARAEDSEISFAGQYTTVLKVKREDLFTAYKKVLASKYGVRALTYRLHAGLADSQTPMAVLLLPMIAPRASGVMYTLDPLDLCRGACLVVTAIPGLATRLVDGSTVPDIFLISRQEKHHIMARQPAPKSDENRDSAPGAKESMCLEDAAAAALAEWGLELEALFGSPQDVEWAQDQAGRLVVLQSRPIGSAGVDGAEPLAAEPEAGSQNTPAPTQHVGVLLGEGTPASVGVAAGPVYRLAGEKELDQVPPGSILVTPTIGPELVSLADRVGAVIAERGSKASHFASVAREFRLPLVVGLGELANSLQRGQIVTVDAHRGVVYDGEVPELLAWQEKQRAKPPIPFQQRLAPVMELISPLNLTDPAAPDFAPGNCRTFHDLVRFVHEKGTREMFSLGTTPGSGLRRAKQLISEIPIVMQVLDLGGGLTPAARDRKEIIPAHFASVPMQAAWAGLADQDIKWSQGLVHLDWERFDQLSAGIFNPKTSAQLASYALVAANYAHLLLRFGYHFAVVDALAGERPEENHIQFRFKGGGGSPEKKGWRLAMLTRVLTHYGFGVKVQEDMLEAKAMRLDQQASQLRLTILGYLLGRTPLLDMALKNEDDALEMAEQLIKKWAAP
ncbi:MAG: PEP/pyruvate-binding domain-containing protein [Desulfurivibrio sp.]